MMLFEGILGVQNFEKIDEKKVFMVLGQARRLMLSFKVSKMHKSIIEVLYHDSHDLPDSFSVSRSDEATFFLKNQFFAEIQFRY